MKFIYLTFLFLCFSADFSQAQQTSVAENKTVYVVGDVVMPSGLKFKEGTTLTEAIALVGGMTQKSNGKIAHIFRLIPGTKDRQIIKVNLIAIKTGKAEDLTLQPFDIIEIPPRKKNKTVYPEGFFIL